MFWRIIKETLAPSGYWMPFIFWLGIVFIIILIIAFILVDFVGISTTVVGSSVLIAVSVSIMMVFFQRIVIEGIEWKETRFEETLERIFETKSRQLLDEYIERQKMIENKNKK